MNSLKASNSSSVQNQKSFTSKQEANSIETVTTYPAVTASPLYALINELTEPESANKHHSVLAQSLCVAVSEYSDGEDWFNDFIKEEAAEDMREAGVPAGNRKGISVVIKHRFVAKPNGERNRFHYMHVEASDLYATPEQMNKASDILINCVLTSTKPVLPNPGGGNEFIVVKPWSYRPR